MTFQAQKAEKKQHVTVDAVILCAVLDLLDDVAVLAQHEDLHVVLVLQDIISRLVVHLQVMRYLGSLAASLPPAARRRVLLLPQAGATGYLIKLELIMDRCTYSMYLSLTESKISAATSSVLLPSRTSTPWRSSRSAACTRCRWRAWPSPRGGTTNWSPSPSPPSAVAPSPTAVCGRWSSSSPRPSSWGAIQ